MVNEYQREVDTVIMLDEYRAEVEKVLKSTSESDDEEEVDLSETVKEIADEVAKGLVEIDDIGTSTDTSSHKAKQSEIGKEKKGRFRWKYQLEAQKENALTKEVKIVHPFLNDDNMQDLLLSEKLIAHAPYRAGYKNITNEWKAFHEIITNVSDPKGVKALANLSESSMRNRYNQYVSISQSVLDKTGLVFPDYTQVDDAMLDMPYSSMSVAQKIAYNFDSIISDVRAMENEDRKREAEKEAAKLKEDTGVSILKAAGLGKLSASSSFDSEVDIGSNKKVRRSSDGNFTTPAVSVQKKAAVGDLQIDSLVRNFESTSKERHEMIENISKKKNDDLQERARMEKEKLDMEKQRWLADEAHRKMMMEFQMNQAAMEAQHRQRLLDLEMARMEMQANAEKNRMQVDLQRDEQSSLMIKLLTNLVGKTENK